MATKYSLLVENKSLVSGTICVYQTMPEQDDDIFSLAWFTKACNPDSKAKFGWTLDYCASWSQTGELVDEVHFEASQTVDVDPSDPKNNARILTFKNKAYAFCNTEQSAAKGTIKIFCDDKIPNLQASIGVGMGGKTAFATQALMNTDFTFIPKVKYWIGFGKYEEGQVMDLSRLNHVAEIKFRPNVYSVTALLGEDNIWQIK